MRMMREAHMRHTVSLAEDHLLRPVQCTTTQVSVAPAEAELWGRAEVQHVLQSFCKPTYSGRVWLTFP